MADGWRHRDRPHHVRALRRIAITLAATPFGAGPGHAQITFTDQAGLVGLQWNSPESGIAAGVAVADFDGDGFVDLFIPNGNGVADQLYRNDGGGLFQEVSAERGVASDLDNRGALWLDYDGDGDLDLLVTRDGGPSILTLFRNDDGSFTDVTQPAGLYVEPEARYDPLHPVQTRAGACAGDIDNDSFLDLCVVTWNGRARLFRNRRDGTFEEVTFSSGLAQFPRKHWQPYIFDFDGDGWRDIYLLVDFEPNLLMLNKRDGTFAEVAAPAGLASAMNEMGIAFGDYDNDGDFDMYITNIYQVDPISGDQFHNILLRNDTTAGVLAFTEMATALGVANGGWGWGTTFLDADRDGWLDIAETNGYTFWTDGSRMFRNSGAAPFVFTDASAAVQFNDLYWGSGLAAFDFERDGDLDLVQLCLDGPVRLLLNEPAGAAANNGYLVVRPRMRGPNSHAIGAVVRVTAGGLNMMRHISAGGSFMSQEPAEAFFGLGAAETIDSVEVTWPDGSATELAGVTVNSVVDVVHGGYGDLNADGDVDAADLTLFHACMTGPRATTGPGEAAYLESCRPADMLGDGDVDLDDYAILCRSVSP